MDGEMDILSCYTHAQTHIDRHANCLCQGTGVMTQHFHLFVFLISYDVLWIMFSSSVIIS